MHIGFAPDCQTYLRICGVKADVAYASGRRISLTRETPDSLGSASLVPFLVEQELQMAAVDIKQADGRTRGFCKRAVAIAAEMSVDRFARIPLSFPTYAGVLGRAAAIAARKLKSTFG